MNQYIIAALLTFSGAYVAHMLSKSYARWKDKKRIISEFAELLKDALPDIKSGVEDAYLFSSDLTKYFTVLEDEKLKLGYKLLPKRVKKHIDFTSQVLGEFVVEFRKLGDYVYSYFEHMKDRKGQGAEPMTTIVATKLVCMNKNELPKNSTLINFPRRSRGHFSSVQCRPRQIEEIWDLGQQGDFVIFKEKRNMALSHVDQLEYMLNKLHGVW